MGFFISPVLDYYEGHREHRLDLEVPQRPSLFHFWSREGWQLDVKAATNAPIDAQLLQLDAETLKAARGLREFIIVVSQAIDSLIAAGTLTGDPLSNNVGIQKIMQAEALASQLRSLRIK